ncbi:MAG TPA: LCP family protein [Solirubrobacteraceae bacterium]|nr:LCP family protein [Solirubrobacteraceae bacterium]
MSSPVAPPPARAGADQKTNFGTGAGGGGRGSGGPPGGYPLPDGFMPPPRRRRYGWRLVLGCLIVLLASGGAAAVAVLEQVHTIVQDISVNKPLTVDSRALAQSTFGQPETFLLIGDDTRSVFKYYHGYVPNLANEMLLIRIDPSKPWISLISLPRELWVNVTEPNGTTYQNRLNSAYTFGTTTLLKTIKQVTGLSVNHVIATTFTQFEKAINKLGCVYDTIDERYYHNNANGGAQYQNVNLQPGYQCLNGRDAEQFVSYRHTDTSQVRDARDQSFLLAAKQQYGPEVANNLGQFEKVFGETVQTDRGLRSPTEILNLANLMISAQGLHVRQVPFQTSPCDGTTCPVGDLTATPQQVQDSIHNFLYGGDTTPKRQVAAISHKLSGHHGLAHLPLTPTLAANVAGEKAAAARLQFTAQFPAVQDLAGSAIPVAPTCNEVVQACIRNYVIHAPDGKAYPIYVEVFSNGDLGQYYDVQGTTWTSAPLFAHPDQTLRAGGRTYLLFYVGSHLETIAWRQYGAIYWVHNTLSHSLGNGEMLAIAEQTTPVGRVRSAPIHVVLKAFSVPRHETLAPPTSTVQSAGRLLGLIAVLLLPVGMFAVLVNRRRLRVLRDHVNSTVGRAALLESRVAAATAGGSGAVALPAAPGAVALPAAPGAVALPAVPGYFPAASPARGPDPFKLYAPGRRRPVALAALGVVAVLVAAGLYVALGSSATGHVARRHQTVIPNAPVVVLNAGQVPHAAHHLALDLTQRHVHVVATGNLDAPPPTTYEVLYRPGDAGQARLLARMLAADKPRVQPMSPSTSQAVGSVPRLAVVIP